MLIDKSKFETQKDLFAFLKANKQQLIASKKSQIKHADGFNFASHVNILFDKEIAHKGNEPISNPSDTLNVLAVINTTNWMDSHEDVHIPGLWTKTLNENKNILHVQEHRSNQFNKIIASGNDVNSYVKDYTWKELGYNYEGTTEALIFDSQVRKTRNLYMWEQYAKGYVTNHSVGMVYVKLDMAVNDPNYDEGFEAWEKYISQVANQEDAITNGYFFPIIEAKLIEGSAVPVGSNVMTPTLENNNITQSQINTEPLQEALERQKEPDYSTLIEGINSIKL
jgi:hypothetical protein